MTGRKHPGANTRTIGHHRARLARRLISAPDETAYPRGVDPITILLALLGGALIGAAVGWTVARATPDHPTPDSTEPPGIPTGAPAQTSVTEQLQSFIAELPGIVLLATKESGVTYASPGSERLRVVRRNRISVEEISETIRKAAITGQPRQRELSLRRPPLGKGRLNLRLRAIPVTGDDVVLLIDDLTEERRVEAVRRDFIANVSHELKTPVGAISLLAEALMSASDDPAAAQHFASRLHNEAERLSNLISDVIDLSRLQAVDPLADAEPVLVDAVVAEAVDHVRATAESRQIEIVIGGDRGVWVIGMAGQLVTAIRNLLMNAITYSPTGTRVAIAVRQRGDAVDIAVKDQGIGIDEDEQGRIFERFYRIDSARSRVTGGTGLGLAIVRNVCDNHGGDVQVWSVPREGSTFTIRLPTYQPGGADTDTGAELDPSSVDRNAGGAAPPRRSRETPAKRRAPTEQGHTATEARLHRPPEGSIR